MCSLPNATPRCAASACNIASCNSGFADCDGSVVNGCETNTQNSALNCGACGTRCNFANAVGSCMSGACVLGACNPGFANCDGNAANGCEAALATDVNNCGACSTRCLPPNATGTCTAGVCGLGSCNLGYGNCDADPANGCEANTTTDTSNCGTCGNYCRSFVYGGTNSCVRGVCVPVCGAGYANCDGNVDNGCEASTNTNLNCGTCGSACSLTCGTGANCRGSSSGSYSRLRYVTPPAFFDACGDRGRQTFLANTDDGAVQVPMPFAMRFWAGTIPLGAMINITSNGWLSLDGIANQSFYALLPDPAAPNAVVAPFFTDLFTSTTGVCVVTTGVAPNRRLVIEWHNAVFLSDRTRPLTFEAILNENGTIEFYYDRMSAPPPGQNIAIGLEGLIGAAAAVHCNPATSCSITTGTRIGFL